MATVKVMYKYVDGAHFFVSNDKETLGLCVAHKDFKTAFNAVSQELNILFKENYKKDVQFEPSISAKRLLEWLSNKTEAALSGPQPGAAGLIPWVREGQGAD